MYYIENSGSIVGFICLIVAFILLQVVRNRFKQTGTLTVPYLLLAVSVFVFATVGVGELFFT